MIVLCRTLTFKLWKKQLAMMEDLLLGQQLLGKLFYFVISFLAKASSVL